MREWTRVADERPETGVYVLVFVNGEGVAGRRFTRRLRAMYAERMTIEATEETEHADYDEGFDTYFVPEGWYEANEYEDTNWKIHDPVTHWMPLPEPPCDIS